MRKKKEKEEKSVSEKSIVSFVKVFVFFRAVHSLDSYPQPFHTHTLFLPRRKLERDKLEVSRQRLIDKGKEQDLFVCREAFITKTANLMRFLAIDPIFSKI